MTARDRFVQWLRRRSSSGEDTQHSQTPFGDFWEPAVRMADYQEARAIARYYVLRARQR